MTAEQFVKSKEPTAYAVQDHGSYNYGNKHKFTVIKAIDSSTNIHCILSSGNSESNAWVEAKKRIKRYELKNK